jgi:hypothetical protein
MSENNNDNNSLHVPDTYTVFFNFMRSKNEPWTIRINDMEKDSEIPIELRIKILERTLKILKESARYLYRTSLPKWGFSGAPRYYVLITQNWQLYNVIGIHWDMTPTHWALFGGDYWAPAIGAHLIKIIARELERIDLEKAGFSINGES